MLTVNWSQNYGFVYEQSLRDSETIALKTWRIHCAMCCSSSSSSSLSAVIESWANRLQSERERSKLHQQKKNRTTQTHGTLVLSKVILFLLSFWPESKRIKCKLFDIEIDLKLVFIELSESDIKWPLLSVENVRISFLLVFCRISIWHRIGKISVTWLNYQLARCNCFFFFLFFNWTTSILTKYLFSLRC